ncbi:MAG: hypothetical protein V3V16_05825 [Melioribacteraceae bacterium]
MKSTISYVLVFALAFVGTSSVIYILNQKYVNIFAFDFRDGTQMQDAMMYLALANGDSLITVDSLFVEQSNTVEDFAEEKNTHVKEEVAEEATHKVKQEKEKQDKRLRQLGEEALAKKEATRKSWLKSTIKMYEAMQAAKAAQLISSIPDEDARDILYAMKKKKAAEILSSLNTETVIRLTRSN